MENFKIKKFNENLESDITTDNNITNYVVSYVKDSRKNKVDMSIGAFDLEDLCKMLKNSFSEREFNSIFKIEIGVMGF